MTYLLGSPAPKIPAATVGGFSPAELLASAHGNADPVHVFGVAHIWRGETNPDRIHMRGFTLDAASDTASSFHISGDLVQGQTFRPDDAAQANAYWKGNFKHFTARGSDELHTLGGTIHDLARGVGTTVGRDVALTSNGAVIAFDGVTDAAHLLTRTRMDRLTVLGNRGFDIAAVQGAERFGAFSEALSGARELLRIAR